MADPYAPFGFAMPGFNPRLPGYQTPNTMTGMEAGSQAMPAPPGWGDRLQSLALGVLNPLGIPMPPPVRQPGTVPTLTGQLLPLPQSGADMRPPDPAGAAIGGLSMAGPAGAAIGAVGRAAGRLATASPRATAAAAGTAAMTAPASTQEPGPARRAPRAREALTAVQQRQRDADQLARDLRGRRERFESMDWNNKDRVREVQNILVGRGLNVKVDGIAGNETRAGLAAYQRDLSQEIQQAEAARQRLDEELTRAQSGVTEAERLDSQTEGSQRMAENKPGFIEQYGPLLGYPLGGAMGYGARSYIGGRLAARNTARAESADRLAADFGQGTVNDRVGRINQFWTEGGRRPAQTPAPFSYSGGVRPYPWQSAAAPSANELYRPPAGQGLAALAAPFGMGAMEMGTATALLPGAQKELSEAQKAVNENPSEANVQRLARARQMEALWETMNNMGRGTVGGGIYAHFKKGPPASARPDVWRADAERANLDQLLSSQPAGPGLARLGSQLPRQPLAAEAAPPVPAQINAPARPVPEGAYQDASGRWRLGRRWIPTP